MNKKILLPLLALAVIPVLAMGMMPDDADKIGKEFAANNPGVTIGVHTLEEEISEQEEVDRAELIVEGTIIAVKPYWKVIHNDTIPRVFSEFIIQVDNVIKGDIKGKTVKVVMTGGVLDGITTSTTGTEIENGSHVIMLLGKDLNSIFGDSYVPISVSKSTYIIEDGEAKNKQNDRSDNKDKVKERISNLVRNN